MFNRKGNAKENPLYKFEPHARAIKSRVKPLTLVYIGLGALLGLFALWGFGSAINDFVNPGGDRPVEELPVVNIEEPKIIVPEVILTKPMFTDPANMIYFMALDQSNQLTAALPVYKGIWYQIKPLAKPERPKLEVGEFGKPAVDRPGSENVLLKLSYYWPEYGGINCDTLNGQEECEYMASGLRVADYVGRAVACPVEWPFWTIVQFDGLEFVCLDRGGAIVKDGSAYWIDVLYPRLPGHFWSEVINGKVILNPVDLVQE